MVRTWVNFEGGGGDKGEEAPRNAKCDKTGNSREKSARVAKGPYMILYPTADGGAGWGGVDSQWREVGTAGGHVW